MDHRRQAHFELIVAVRLKFDFRLRNRSKGYTYTPVLSNTFCLTPVCLFAGIHALRVLYSEI